MHLSRRNGWYRNVFAIHLIFRNFSLQFSVRQHLLEHLQVYNDHHKINPE